MATNPKKSEVLVGRCDGDPFVVAARSRMRDPAFLELKGPNGRRLCFGCETEVTGRRVTWCSFACTDRYMMAVSQAYVRRRVKERDQTVCVVCGLNCAKYKREMARRWRDAGCPANRSMERWFEPGVDLNMLVDEENREFAWWLSRQLEGNRRHFLLHGVRKSWWEADHVLALVRGGGTGLDNLETVCVHHHRIRTTELRKQLADGAVTKPG